jgi:hypothetical protein
VTYKHEYERRHIVGKEMVNYLHGIDGFSKGLNMDDDTKKIIREVKKII